jgi:predicted short-subunit dehydrogenase-like oxidoreductase (DUF2520 family)
MDRSLVKIAVYGPGRAGGTLALAASRAGHEITSVDGRDRDAVARIDREVGATDGTPDLLIVALADDALFDAWQIVDIDQVPPAVVHVSGAVSTSVLDRFASAGALTGSFHPLQTLPDSHTGASRLAGAHVAVTAPPQLRDTLFDLALSLGCVPFEIDDETKPLYHAAAAASANYTLAALGVASDLFEAAGVEFSSARPLVQAIVDNAFELGPDRALTGPIARGDVATVESQLAAVADGAPELLEAFTALARITATLAGTESEFTEVLS